MAKNCPTCGLTNPDKVQRCNCGYDFPEAEAVSVMTPTVKPRVVQLTDIACEKCGKPMAIRASARGRFLGCSGYPKCRNAKPLPPELADKLGVSATRRAAPATATPEMSDEKCEKCGSPMLIRTGRFGRFMACSTYPACKTTRKLPALIPRVVSPTASNDPPKRLHDVHRNSSLNECKPLMEAAGRKLFQNNAFRITGLSVDATAREIANHAVRVRVMEQMGEGANAHTAVFALNPPPSLDQIREAIQKLKDPQKRIIDEFFWFWPQQFGDSASDPAFHAMARGDSQAALEIWSSKEEDPSDGIIAVHNLALVYHLTALDWEHYNAGNEVDARRRTKIARYWKEAFKRWERLADDDRLWEAVTNRIRQINDASLTAGFARGMRATLPQALDKINAELAVAYAENGDMELAAVHIRFMRETHQGLDDVDKTAEMVLTPARTRLKEQIKLAQQRGAQNPLDAAKAAVALFEQAQSTLALFDLFFGKNNDIRNELFDEVADVCSRLPAAYYKATGDDKTCLEILRAVLPLATSIEIRQHIENGIGVLTGELANKALEPIYARLKGIQDSKDHPRLRLEKFQREALPALTGITGKQLVNSESHSEVFDAAAIVLRGISLDAWNTHQDRATAVAANELALKYASNAELKQRLLNDRSVLQQIPRPSAIETIGRKIGRRLGPLGCLVPIGVGMLMLFGLISQNSNKQSSPNNSYGVPATSYTSTSSYGSAPSSYTPPAPSAPAYTPPSGAEQMMLRQTTSAQQASKPAVDLVFHNDKTPRNVPQIEIYNLASRSSAYDSSQTLVTGDIRNGTAQPFGYVRVALVAFDKRGHETSRQLIFVSNLVAGGIRPFEICLGVPLETIARHRFDLVCAQSYGDSSPSYPSQFDSKPTYRIPRNYSAELQSDKQAIERQRSHADLLETEVGRLSREIETDRLFVDRTSQFAVDAFNNKVSQYKAKVEEANAQTRLLNQMVDNYNDKLRRYGR